MFYNENQITQSSLWLPPLEIFDATQHAQDTTGENSGMPNLPSMHPAYSVIVQTKMF